MFQQKVKGKDDGDMDDEALNSFIVEPWYWGYGQMLLRTESVLDDQRKKYARCPCHMPKPSDDNQDRMKLEAPCPCSGMWAPQICAGELHKDIHLLIMCYDYD